MTIASYSPDEQSTEQHLLAGKRRRRLREALTGYLFVLPATIVTFVFGLWPVVAGFYESLKSGSPITNRYVGIQNYLRSLGSLAYILLFALSLIFVYIAYRAWRSILVEWRTKDGGSLWYYLLPGLIGGLGLITLSYNLVTGSGRYAGVPPVLLLLALGGYCTADYLQQARSADDTRQLLRSWLMLILFGAVWIGGPRLLPGGTVGSIGWLVLLALLGGLAYLALPVLSSLGNIGSTISSTLLIGTLSLLGVFLSVYTYSQLAEDVKEAQEITRLIFNQDILDATANITEDNVRIGGLTLEGEVIVPVEVNGEVIEAPLVPETYTELPVDKIARLQAAFANGQKVEVVLPDGTVAEGVIQGLEPGEHMDLAFTAEDSIATREVDIYSALDVGEPLIRASGHTEPLWRQVAASIFAFLGLVAVYKITIIRRSIDDEIHPHLHSGLYWGRIILAVMIMLAVFYLIGSVQLNRKAAIGMGVLTKEQFTLAYKHATGEAPRATLSPDDLKAELLYWPQTLLVTIGALLIGAAYMVWHSAQKRETPLGFSLTILLALMMMVGGWLAIGQLPQTLTLAGREAEDTKEAVMRTVMYAVGTVPIQLALGLFLAYLLFSEITWGKSLYRIIYFMPYIAPSVATSTVFLVIFRPNERSLANQALSVFGIDTLLWLKEPKGVFAVLFDILGGNPAIFPEALEGPSLALVTVILYNIWVFAGYNTVIFLAGLGAIPAELYEAAEVDGAGRWSRFRNITLPLLSPTTFFLSMLSIIGTFKAFTHIYVLRRQAAGKAVDTMSVHIFNTLYSANDPGYAAALAFMLFGMILILTLVQNRLVRGQVFYG